MADKLYEITGSLTQDFITDLKNGNVSDVLEWVDGIIDSATIYTSDCYEIMHELMVCDFDEYIANFGEVTSISSLAWFYLKEYIHDSVKISDLEEVMESYERYGEIIQEMEDIKQNIEELLEEDEDYDVSDESNDYDNLKEELEEVVEFLTDFGFEIKLEEEVK